MRRPQATLIFLLRASPASVARGQATRTWVSGLGDDVNPCSRTAPCKTFAGAISKTAAGGEIDALDPAGYGAVTITKSITIDGGGSLASILVSGTSAIFVNDGGANNIEVALRRLNFQGVYSGLNGIRFISGRRLTVDSCVIEHFTQNGIDVVTTAPGTYLNVLNTKIDTIYGIGINVSPTVGPFYA